jgi:hypothetical protein
MLVGFKFNNIDMLWKVTLEKNTFSSFTEETKKRQCLIMVYGASYYLHVCMIYKNSNGKFLVMNDIGDEFSSLEAFYSEVSLSWFACGYLIN